MRSGVLIITALLAGCSTFNLGSVQPQASRTADQQQLDTLTCKDQARLAADSPGQQTKEFLLGFTIVGYPAAIASDKAKQRGVFAECMKGKGYTVTPAT